MQKPGWLDKGKEFDEINRYIDAVRAKAYQKFTEFSLQCTKSLPRNLARCDFGVKLHRIQNADGNLEGA